MHANKRIRLDIDGDTYELHRYFAQLRGLSTNQHLARILASYAASAEGEFPSLRAHMLAWRSAFEVERILDEQSARLAVVDIDAVPF